MVGFILGVVLLVIALRHMQRRAVITRKAENWAHTLEHAVQALAEYQDDVVPRRCVLVTGYAVRDEASATALREWVQHGTGERTDHWAETDPTFGPYWVVETRTEPLLVTPRLAARWVARMRITCEHAACRVHHFAADFGGAPPPEATTSSYAE